MTSLVSTGQLLIPWFKILFQEESETVIKWFGDVDLSISVILRLSSCF